MGISLAIEPSRPVQAINTFKMWIQKYENEGLAFASSTPPWDISNNSLAFLSKLAFSQTSNPNDCFSQFRFCM